MGAAVTVSHSRMRTSISLSNRMIPLVCGPLNPHPLALRYPWNTCVSRYS